jgi:hypothetical protein
MDFRTERGSRYNPQPRLQRPVAEAPLSRPAIQEAIEDSEPKKRVRKTAAGRPRNVKRGLQVLGAILLLAFIIWLIHGYITTKNQLEQQNTSASHTPTQQLVSQVGKKVELPAETPVIYTVNDAQKLKNQAFFADAKNGDKVLYFPGAKVAALYRPSTDKVIRYQPVSLEGAGSGTSSTP